VRGEWGEFKNYRDYLDAVNNELVIVPMIERDGGFPSQGRTLFAIFGQGILSLARLSGSSDQMRLHNGAVRPPPHEAEPAAPHLGRNGST
jgi:hypothetical protein